MENNVTASEQAQSVQEIHINEIIRPYARKWPWFIIGALIALVLAYFYLKTTTPVYKVQSTVLIKDSKASSSAAGDMGVLKDLSGLGEWELIAWIMRLRFSNPRNSCAM